MSRNFEKTLILSILLFLPPGYTTLQGGIEETEDLLATTKEPCPCCTPDQCAAGVYKDGSDSCCNSKFTYPDDPGTSTNGKPRPTPRCCPAYFDGFCCDGYTALCYKDQKAPPDALFNLLGNTFFNNVSVDDALQYECYCDSRCSPPQIVCKLNNENFELVRQSYCAGCWELYCYCKDDSRIAGASNPCQVLYEEYTTTSGATSSGRKSQPDCCYEKVPQLNWTICGDKSTTDMENACTSMYPTDLDLPVRN